MDRLLVSVVNYSDPEFYTTIKSLWENAKNKDSIIFSLVSEDSVKFDFSFIPEDQIIYRHFDTSEYRGGLCWARNLAIDINIEYKYFIQFDSHTYASYGWDASAIKRFTNIKNITNEKFIIAYAPANYEILDDGSIDFNVPNKISMYANDYKKMIPGFQFPEYRELENEEIVRSYWATCCYLFAPAEWVRDVGISKLESFNTEEIALSIRTYAKSWKIFSIGTRDVFHHISHKQPSGVITRQTLRPWADERKDAYWKHVEGATDRLSRLMCGDLDVKKEKVQEFFELTGLSFDFLSFIPNYSSYVEIENRGYGMPPRKDYN